MTEEAKPKFKDKYSVRQFAAKFKFSPEYVRQMCRQQEPYGGGSVPYRLPNKWKAKKVGKTWVILRRKKKAS